MSTSQRTRLSAFLLSAIFAPTLWADPAPCVTSSASEPEQETLPSCDDLYPTDRYGAEASPWRVGFGGGYGERSNPLINSDDIPLYGIVQLSYFGERFFFDNGDIGWFIEEGNSWSLNAVAGVGGERSFFSFLNEGSISFNPSGAHEGLNSGVDSEHSGLPTGPPGEAVEETVIEPEAPERDYTVDGGLELLYEPGMGEIQLQLLTDLSGRHKGQELWFAWGLPQVHGRWEIAPTVGFTWKSSDAANYYYGVREDEAEELGLSPYEVGAAINPFARLSLSYRLNGHWKVVSVLHYEHLDSAIQDSPAVEDSAVTTAFVGLYYEF
jgi:outer membrane protein